VRDPADLGKALAEGAQLVVLPELAQTRSGRTEDPETLADEADAFLDGLRCDAVVVTSVVRRTSAGFAHVAVAVTQDGILEQRSLHASARHPWVTDLGDEVLVVATEVGRLALLVGDDAIYPEAVRLAAIAEAEVVALPFTVLEPWELQTGLVERAAENRVNVVASAREAGAILAAHPDFTLWTPWQRSFDGTISYPLVQRSEGPEPLVGPIHPAVTANRFVSRGTDVVDGRPWRLASALTAE
jgi:predicted amidohydrolase